MFLVLCITYSVFECFKCINFSLSMLENNVEEQIGVTCGVVTFSANH